MARDWNAIGLDWLTEDVSKQFGENNQSDKRIVGYAQLPVVTSLDKLAEAGVDVLAWINSANSLRVRAQSLGRSAKLTLKATAEQIEALREKVFGAMLGVRMTGGRVVERIVEVTVRNLPDGTVYKGSDENEYRSAYAAALADMGVESDKALDIATKVAF